LNECIRSEVCNEISKYLRLEYSARLKGKVVLAKLYNPFGELIREL